MGHQVVSVEWEGRSVDAFVPALLASYGEPGTAAMRAVARAEGALEAAVALDPRLEIPARLLLRAEGVASSRIEAINAPAELVALADRDPSIGGPAAWVAGNLRAVDAALAHWGPLTTHLLFDWHRVLMATSDLDPAHVGAWRDRLGWVGGPTPHRAAHVAAPPDRIADLMADLVAYANGTAHDPVTQAALVHAQFETIHPFADGNGRLGRILIGWLLRRRLGTTAPPPVSVAFLRDVGGYLAGLTLFRTDGPDRWVAWFAATLERAAIDAGRTLADITDLARSWPERITDLRADAAAHRLIPLLLEHPAVDVSAVVELLGVSAPAARNAVHVLVEREVLRPADIAGAGVAGRVRHWWVAGELLDLLAR
ncbi:MAG: Fic family protein [Acidimicrobiia bacterium]|nr:Fic family protein [Acidimicrobiia bacterium]